MYTRFILILAGMTHESRSIGYETETPITWAEARDRLIAAGATEGFVPGGWGPGQFMLSIDTERSGIASWQPLPGGV